MKLEELREQIQEDLLTFLNTHKRRAPYPECTRTERIMDGACQIVVDNFNRYEQEQ